jgi:para-nitrobenzyl esterase
MSAVFPPPPSTPATSPVKGAPSSIPILQTRRGALRGAVERGVNVFRGVPYAQPPFGPRRLQPPQPMEPWAGVRDALVFGPEPYQPRMPAEQAAGMVWDPAVPGDDCLNLNIWTPELGHAGLPVMVWIPGGMFEVGTGATYDGSRFARDGVVCVTINYRVGAEGFMLLPDGTANLGLLDQIAALEWVRDEIAVFGGDPDNVTIFGESAGAMSVGTLLAVPRADGLFRRAILQSGAADRVVHAATAARTSRSLAERLGIGATREAFAGVDPARLVSASTQLKGEVLADPDPDRWGLEVVASALPWQPVIDGSVLPEPPIEAIRAGSAARVDVITGSNLDDWALFVVANGSFERVTEDILAGAVAEHGFESAAAFGVTPRMLETYRAAYLGASAPVLLAIIQTDWWCRVPALRLAEARLPGPGRTYMYEFAWRSPVGGPIGACHALELPFVFDTLDLGPAQMLGGLLGPQPPQSLAESMHRAWTTFATTGDPGWPTYEATHRETMRFDVASLVLDDPRAFERRLWGVA